MGARSDIGETEEELASLRKGATISMDSLEMTASSSTLCKRVFTWPLNRASPEPGVIVVFFFAVDDNGVSIMSLPFASPTIGESFDMSTSAHRLSCCCCALLLCRVFETLFFPEHSSFFFPVKTKIKNINIGGGVSQEKAREIAYLKRGCCWRRFGIL